MIGDLPLDEVSPFAVEKFKREPLSANVSETVRPVRITLEGETGYRPNGPS
jgi:hypothetical protein